MLIKLLVRFLLMHSAERFVQTTVLLEFLKCGKCIRVRLDRFRMMHQLQHLLVAFSMRPAATTLLIHVEIVRYCDPSQWLVRFSFSLSI